MREPGYRYDADARGWDLIPSQPADEPEKDCLVVLEVSSGRRYGMWCTEALAEEYRTNWRAAWESGSPHVGGVMEWGDVTLRSDAIVAIHVPPGIGTIDLRERRPGTCRACGRPFSPTHDIHAGGPTSRHPFLPVQIEPGVR